MKSLSKLFFILIFIGFSTTSKAQVLISLLFGDALNTEKIEFGLIGGENRSYMRNYNESTGLNNFNIGFYFHINMFKTSYLSTGVLVKSNVGAKGMATYPVGDPEFDELFEPGELTTKLNYFYVPIMWHQRFNNRWYLEGGLQLGLRSKAYDYFTLEDINGGEMGYNTDVRDDYTHFDGGFVGGAGYKLKKKLKSSAIGINYYYGLKNVSKIDGTTIKNSSVYFYVKIPIGLGKAPKDSETSEPKKSKKEKKSKKKEQN